MSEKTYPFPFVVGVNYMPREHGCQLWSDWSEADIERDFKQIKELGLNTVRTFLFWEDFQPAPDLVSPVALSRLRQMRNIAQKYSLKLIPTFFTGHMSGEHFDVPWRAGRDIYEDPSMLRPQVELVRDLANRYSSDDTILGWDLANEQEAFLAPKTPYAGWLWTHILYRELKAFDPMHPVTLGTNVLSLEKDKFRFDLITVDYLCTHPYPMYTQVVIDPLDSIRSTLYPAFTSKLAQCLGGKEVMLQEFGTSTEMTSDELSARFYQSVLYSSIANDTIGVLAWCFADYSTCKKPYATSTHEFEFGIINKRGQPKKQAEVLRQFAADVDQIHYDELMPEKRRAAIMVPTYYYGSHDVFLPDHSQEAYFRSLFSAYILAKQANINVDFIQPDAIPLDKSSASWYDLLILPCVTVKGYLTAQQAVLLQQYVYNGGNVYCSYNGITFPALPELFGFKVKTQEFVLQEVLLNELGRKDSETGLRYQHRISKRLIVEDCGQCGGEVVYSDQDDDPAVIIKKHKDEKHKEGGTTVFVTYPIEYYLSFMSNAAHDNTSYELYKRAGSNISFSDVTYSDPFVESQLFDGKDSRYLLFINHSKKEKKLTFNMNLGSQNVEVVAPGNLMSSKYGNSHIVVLSPNGYAILRA
jgi:beta-galactosidase